MGGLFRVFYIQYHVICEDGEFDFFFTDGIVLYIENPKDSTPRLLELIQQFGSVARYKINAQMSLAFLYINQTEERN